MVPYLWPFSIHILTAKLHVLTQHNILSDHSSDGGCYATDSVTVYVSDGGNELVFPNTFTPNGDGTNDMMVYFRTRKISQAPFDCV